MTAFRVFLARIRALLTGRRRDAELDDEVRAHIEMCAEDLVRRGMSPAQARDAARREFGGLDQIKEEYRHQRSLPAVETFARDVQHGVRLLWRSPGFATAAVVSLALGTGATCVIFALVNASLLKELPVRDPGRVVAVAGYVTRGPSAASGSVPPEALQGGHDLSYPLFRELSSIQRALSDIAGSGGLSLTRLQIGGQSLDVSAINAAFVSANYFSMLGVNAVAGRTFTEADSRQAGEGPVVVLAYGFWQRQFGGDPTAVGQTIIINDTPLTIIGVTPRGFFGDRIGMVRDIWVPILMQPNVMPRNMLESRTANFFRTIGRLAPGVTEEQANTELTVLYRQLKAQEMSSGTGSLIGRAQPDQYRLVVTSGTEGLNAGARQRFKRPFFVLQAVTVVVLLIACCNVANLLMARGAARQREIAIRMAVGASRGRLVRQLLIESLLIAAAGAAFGLVIAQWAAGVLITFFGIGVFELSIDLTVLLFAMALTLVTTLFFGVLPALQNTSTPFVKAGLGTAFRETGAAPRRRLARGLVVVQVGLSLWLLIGAGLLVRTLQNFQAVDIGMDRHSIMLVNLQSVKPMDTARGAAVQETLSQRLLTTPGVTAVAFSSYGMIGGGANTAPVRVPDSPVSPDTDGEVRNSYVSPNFFSTVGMRLIRGREFTDRDSATAPKVAILNETMARHYFGQEDPLGKIVYFPGVDDQRRYIPFDRGLDKAQPVEVVGVVRDARFENLREPVRRMAYVPLAQGAIAASVQLRTTGEIAGLADDVRRIVSEADPNLVVSRFSSLNQQIDRTLGGERTVAALLAVFGSLAVVLACVGLYGVMAYGVARRQGEIGVRIALGASRTAVVRLVLGETMLLVILGVALGVPAALGTTHFLRSLLFGLSPSDPATIAGMVIAMAAVGALAGWIPARRAARVDAVTALRCE